MKPFGFSRLSQGTGMEGERLGLLEGMALKLGKTDVWRKQRSEKGVPAEGAARNDISSCISRGCILWKREASAVFRTF